MILDFMQQLSSGAHVDLGPTRLRMRRGRTTLWVDDFSHLEQARTADGPWHKLRRKELPSMRYVRAIFVPRVVVRGDEDRCFGPSYPGGYDL